METNHSHFPTSIRTLAACACLLALAASPTLAVDGVIEINQTRADFGGVTPGDAAGFPISITASGSYRLTGNLTVPGGVDGIFISAPDVSLDLNGFAVQGPVVCTNTGDQGSTVSCSPSVSGVGIVTAAERVYVHNGQVSGFGFAGIGNSGHQGSIRLENLMVTSNGDRGLNFCDSVTVVIKCVIVIKNGGIGIMVATGAQVINSQASENGSHGIFVFVGGAQVRGNVVRANDGDGIQFNGGTGPDSMVAGNTITQNTGLGITGVGGIGYLYTQNVIDGNGGGTTSGGTQMGTNACNGNTTCP